MRVARVARSSGALVLFMLVSGGLRPIHAQAIEGRVLEETRETPIPDAAVSLLASDGTVVERVATDALGRYRLVPTVDAEYFVEAERIGYRRTRSPLLALGVEGTSTLDLMLSPDPIGLEGFEVSADRVEVTADRLLRNFGLDRERLGKMWIGREQLDRMAVSSLTTAVRYQNIAMVRVPYGASPMTEPLCVLFRGSPECALTVLNGAIVDPLQVNQIEPTAIEGMALLSPLDATTFYGTAGGNGAVLVWIRER